MSDPPRSDDASHGSVDDVIAVYKRSVDRALIREMLQLSPEQRFRRLLAFLRTARELRRAMRDRS